MPRRSMSPSTVEVTLVSSTPRAAAMLAIPEVRQAASAGSSISAGVGAWSLPTNTSGWSVSMTVGCWCCISWPAPK